MGRFRWRNQSESQSPAKKMKSTLLACCVHALLVTLLLARPDRSAASQHRATPVAAAMEAHMDRTVEPCDDFYEYACGNWRAPYNLRSYRPRDTLGLLRADNKRQLLQYLRGMEAYAEHPELQGEVRRKRHTRIAVNLYTSCAEALAGGNSSAPAYTDVLKRFSDWPVLNAYFLEASANASFNWEYVAAEMRRYGVQAMWQVAVQPNWQASEQSILYVTPPNFDHMKASSQAADHDEDSLFLYHRYVKYLMLDLGVRVRKAIRIADEVIEFEKQLFALVSRADSLVLQAPQTVTALRQRVPGVDVGKYFATLLKDFRKPEDYERRLLVVANTEYMRRLAALLRRSKAETIGKYLLVKFLGHFEVQKLEVDLDEKEYCLQQVNSFYPRELSQVFLELQHGSKAAEFLQQTESQLTGIFASLKRQFEAMINTSSVFERDANTKALGLEKLRAMRLILPSVSLTAVGGGEDFEPSPDKYEENLLVLSKMRAHQELAAIHQVFAETTSNRELSPTSPSASVRSPITAYGPLSVNAYYRLKKNAIEIPIGLLRSPLYDGVDGPKARLYGSLVYIIAHELFHGFDYDGLNYDKSGNVANNWGAKSIISFGTKSGCYLGERYNANSAVTINENIADSEGLRLALDSLQVAATEVAKSPADLVASLQMFFTSFAQVWCSSGITATKSSSTSVHADHRERVNNVLRNFPEFTDVYRCKETSAMVPQERCRIW